MLREVDETVLWLMLGWRNHPQVRGVSFTTHVIGEDEHARWWQGVCANPLREVRVFEYDGVPRGVVTYELPEDPAQGVVWGFFLDIDGLKARSALMAAWSALEVEAIEYAFAQLAALLLRGEMRATNLPVVAHHRRCGFTVTSTGQVLVDGEVVDVVEMSLTREQWDARPRRGRPSV